MTRFFSLRVRTGTRVLASGDGLRLAGHLPGCDPVVAVRVPGATGPDYGITPWESATGSADEAQDAVRASETLVRLGGLHRQQPRPLVPEEADRLSVPEYPGLLREARRKAVAALPWHALVRRRRAREAADEVAGRAAARFQQAAAQAQAAAQRRRDRAVALLRGNDEGTVLVTLDRLLGDAGAPVTAVGVAGTEVSLAVLVPGPEALPPRYPVTTGDGEPLLRDVSPALAADWYRQLVAGQVVVAARQAFACCSGIDTAAVVAVREEAAGTLPFRPVLATRLSRSRLDRLNWDAVTAWDVVELAGHDTVLRPLDDDCRLGALDLDDQPDLADLVARIEPAGERADAERPSSRRARRPRG